MNTRTARFSLRAVLSFALAGAAAGQTTTRVSVSSDGVSGNAHSRRPCISADGRIVVFHSMANNLVPNDSNGDYDVFVHDRVTGVTRLVSASSSGAQGIYKSWYPSISADGRFVAFESESPNLVAGDTNNKTDIFVHELLTGQTRRASVSSSGAQANGATYHAFLSRDGRYVSFWGDASNLVPGDTNGTDDGFVHDTVTGETVRVSVSTAGVQSNGRTTITKISHSGRQVVFMSRASNFVPNDTNPEYDIFVHDLDAGTTELVSKSTSGEQANYDCYDGSISGDGNVVSFSSLADNLVPGDSNGTWDAFVHDRITGATELACVNSAGVQGAGWSNGGTVSTDGRFIAFQSIASNLVEGDTNGFWDIFVRDRVAGTTVRVSVDSAGSESNGDSFYPAAAGISADGSLVVFDSLATNLVPGDSNGFSDAFIHYLPPILPPLPFPASDQPAATAIADFDADALGRLDLAVVNAGSNTVSLLLNNGVPGAEPSFAPPSPAHTTAVGAQPRAIATADIDDDNDPDLAVVNGVSGTVSILLNDGDGAFALAPAVSAPGAPRAVALLDLDNDGLCDLLVSRSDADTLSIHRNLGGGVFGADQPQNVPPGGHPNGVGSGDLDNDKDIDPVVSLTGTGHLAVYMNTSPGPGVIALAPAQLFSVGTGDPRSVSVVVAHLDGDPFLDVAVANTNTNAVAALRNKGVDGGGAWLGFEDPVEFGVGALPVSIGAADIYGAGSIDLFTANAFVDATDHSSFSLLKNASTPGSIAFEPERRIDLPPLAAHVAWGDVNLDGRTDVAVATGFNVATITDSPTRERGSARRGWHARGSPFGVAAVLAGASPSVVLAPCDGDANGDRVVDFLDLNIVLSNYGQSGPALPGDLDADEDVDFVDLNIVLSAFGTAC